MHSQSASRVKDRELEKRENKSFRWRKEGRKRTNEEERKKEKKHTRIANARTEHAVRGGKRELSGVGDRGQVEAKLRRMDTCGSGGRGERSD